MKKQRVYYGKQDPIPTARVISQSEVRNSDATKDLLPFFRSPTDSAKIDEFFEKESSNQLESLLAPGLQEAVQASFLSGWILCAEWVNQTGSPVTLFGATMTVPHNPPKDDFQTLMLFNGLGSQDWLIQCILQWGVSKAGGGSFWSITSMFVAKDPHIHPKWINAGRVNPGTTIQMVIRLLDRNPNGCIYRMEFPHSGLQPLDIGPIDELQHCVLTLETQGVENTRDYPPDQQTAFERVEIRTANGVVDHLWADTSLHNMNGERLVRISPQTVLMQYHQPAVNPLNA